VLDDRWYAANRVRKCGRRQGWDVGCALQSNRQLDDTKRAPWPQALRHQRAPRVPLTAPDPRQRTDLVRTLPGTRTTLPFAVWGRISPRHPRDKHPQDFLCPNRALSAQQSLSISQKRWPIAVDHCYVNQHGGLTDFRVQSDDATAKWWALVFRA
jgi:hypothetical protein